jgi:SAM-dependent methyltransferase
MMDFSERGQSSEWMDEPCSYADFRACLHDLEQVNRMVLAYRPTLQWLRQFVDAKDRPLHIVDVGCGGGDMLRHIASWARARQSEVVLTGIDLNPHAGRAAREFSPGSCEIEWITGDAFSYQPKVPIDLVISSLFTHHLPDATIILFLQWMERVSERGWFINDLHRERIPYYGFGALARLMRWHRFVQHDGPISIHRSFTPEDWVRYVSAAGLAANHVGIRTRWPARLCVGRVK